MGYVLHWLAVRGGTAATVLPHLGLLGTGRREDTPDSPLLGAELPGDWYLVIANGGERQQVNEAAALRLSQANDVIYAEVDERVNRCSTHHFQAGREAWSARHDAQRGVTHLEVSGALPPHYPGIRDALAAQQTAAGTAAAVDYYFSIPLELARSLTGYLHDDDMAGMGADPFEVLTTSTHAHSAEPAKKPGSWWRRAFGG